jgi:hypothetical protein
MVLVNRDSVRLLGPGPAAEPLAKNPHLKAFLNCASHWSWRLLLAKELKASGVPTNLNRLWRAWSGGPSRDSSGNHRVMDERTALLDMAALPSDR